MTLTDPPTWSGPSADPVDEQFGDIVTPTTFADVDGFDAVLVGEPYDGAVIGRVGAAEAPRAIREELTALKTHHFDRGPLARIGDLGDVDLPDESPNTVQEQVRRVTTRIHERETLPLFLGGDNSLTYPNVAPLLDDGTVTVMSFDAHLDCRIVDDEPTSGSPYRQLYEAGLDQLTVVGARHFETSTDYHTYLMDRGGSVTTASSFADEPETTIESLLADIDTDAVYLSVDIDVLDAVAAPGVSAPTPGGVSTRVLFDAVRRVASSDRLRGMEIVECAPPLDDDGRTVAAAARVVAHMLGGAIP